MSRSAGATGRLRPPGRTTATRDYSRWLLRRPAEDAVGRVFCFPYSGVGASMFRRWPRWIDGVEVCPVQLPARENRLAEPHFGTYEQLARTAAAALRPYLDRPFALFGHCAGALSAFETSRAIAETGCATPARLIVSAQAPPHLCPQDRFLDLTDDELAAELRGITVAQGGVAHPLLIELTLRVLHLDLDANRVYRGERARQPYGITTVGWTADEEIGGETLREWTGYAEDVTFREFAGGHYEFLSAPRQLLELVATYPRREAKDCHGDR